MRRVKVLLHRPTSFSRTRQTLCLKIERDRRQGKTFSSLPDHQDASEGNQGTFEGHFSAGELY